MPASGPGPTPRPPGSPPLSPRHPRPGRAAPLAFSWDLETFPLRSRSRAVKACQMDFSSSSLRPTMAGPPAAAAPLPRPLCLRLARPRRRRRDRPAPPRGRVPALPGSAGAAPGAARLPPQGRGAGRAGCGAEASGSPARGGGAPRGQGESRPRAPAYSCSFGSQRLGFAAGHAGAGSSHRPRGRLQPGDAEEQLARKAAYSWSE